MNLAQQLANQSQKRIRSPILRGDEVEQALSPTDRNALYPAERT